MNKYNIKFPIAKKIDNLITLYNDTRNDKFSWIRDSNWPKINDEILDYLKSENEATKQYLDKYQKLQNKIFKELKSRIKETDESYPVKKDNYYYYSRSVKGKNYSIKCRKKDSLKEEEEVIFDANKMSKKHVAFSMSAFSINKNHQLLAYSTDLVGAERYTIYIKNLSTKKTLKDKIEGTIGDIVWHEILQGFFYTKLEENWRTLKVYFHKLGTDQDDDKLIFEEKDETFRVGIYSSSDDRYMFIDSSSSEEDEIWYIDLTLTDFVPKLIIPRSPQLLYSVDHKNEEFYIKTNDKGKNFRLIKFAVKNLDNKEKWIEVIPHEENIYLTDFDLAKNFLAVTRREGGLEQITIYDNKGDFKKIKISELNYSLSGSFPTFESELFRISFSSLVTPSSLLEYDFYLDKLYTRKTQEIPCGYNKDLYKQERIFATSDDGTKIPISLVYRKDLFKKDGTNSLYLYAYGSYGISISPSFNSSILSLIDRGFVFAISHIRGGDDLGFKWYESAKFLSKKLTFTDFITTSEYLVDNKYTNSNSLIISGGSAGGMLMGVVVNMRPDLYKAAIARVPFVDVLNTMLDESLPLTPGEFKEWGNPKDEKYYHYIKSYSPYDNIKKQNYPAIFVTAGLTDPRVTYWEPAKWVAKLREHNTGDNLILLYTEMESGHQGQSGRYDALKETSKVFTFVLTVGQN